MLPDAQGGTTLYEKHIRDRRTRRWRFADHIVSHTIIGDQILWAKFGDCGFERAEKFTMADSVQLHARFETERQWQSDAV